MWFYYSEKSRKEREAAERERRIKRRQSDFELDDSEYVIDDHLYLVFFFGRIFNKCMVSYQHTLIAFFILGLYFPIFHLFIFWKYICYTCDFMIIDEEINWDFHDETQQLLLLTKQGGYLGFETVYIALIYDELGYVYWDNDDTHEYRADRLNRYEVFKNWFGFSDNSYILENKKDYIHKKSKLMKSYLEEEVIIINDKNQIINLNRKGTLFIRKSNLSKINNMRNRLFCYLNDNNNINLNKDYGDYLTLNKNRGSARQRFSYLEDENYNDFNTLHHINLEYFKEDKNDDYYN